MSGIIGLQIKIHAVSSSSKCRSDIQRRSTLVRPVSRFNRLHSTISSDKIISSTAPHGEPDSEEDIIPSEFEPPAKSARRGSGGKTAGFCGRETLNCMRRICGKYVHQSSRLPRPSAPANPSARRRGRSACGARALRSRRWRQVRARVLSSPTAFLPEAPAEPY